MTSRLVFTGRRFEFRAAPDAVAPVPGDMPVVPQIRRHRPPPRLDGFKPLRSGGNGYRPGKLVDLGHDQCRFTLASGLMCGAKGAPWCGEHRRVVFARGG